MIFTTKMATAGKSGRPRVQQAGGTVEIVTEAEPAEDPISGDKLLSTIKDVLLRHVILPPGVAEPIAAWIVLPRIMRIEDKVLDHLEKKPLEASKHVRMLAEKNASPVFLEKTHRSHSRQQSISRNLGLTIGLIFP